MNDTAHAFMPLENPLARAAAESRYDFACDKLEGGRVLEAGCGARSGAVRLSAHAAWVVAVDLSIDGVHVAATNYAADNVRYAVMDCQSLALRPGSFDAVVSLEVIEHLPDQCAYVEEIHRILKPGGTFIATTPNRERPDYRPNEHHVHEFTATELRDTLRRFFDPIEMYAQYASELVHGRGLKVRATATRLDKLGIRRLIPQSFKDFVNRRFFTLKSAHLVGAEDWLIAPGIRPDAPVLACVCRKPLARPRAKEAAPA